MQVPRVHRVPCAHVATCKPTPVTCRTAAARARRSLLTAITLTSASLARAPTAFANATTVAAATVAARATARVQHGH